MWTDIFGFGNQAATRRYIKKLIDDESMQIVVLYKGNNHRGVAYTTETVNEARQLMKEAEEVLQCHVTQLVKEKSSS